MRCGPHTPRSPARCASNAMVWMVLPSPISSASTPFSRRSCIDTSQSSPARWYSRSGRARLSISGRGTACSSSSLGAAAAWHELAASSGCSSSLVPTTSPGPTSPGPDSGPEALAGESGAAAA
jgi:hypothetical protein